MFFMKPKPDERETYYVLPFRVGRSHPPEYDYDLQPEFVQRKAARLMRFRLGMSWREAVDLVYKRRRDAIARVNRARRIAAAREIDPR